MFNNSISTRYCQSSYPVTVLVYHSQLPILPYTYKRNERYSKDHKATPFLGPGSTPRNSTSLPVLSESASKSVEIRGSSLLVVLSRVPIPLSFADLCGILPVLYMISSLTILQLVTKKMTQFQKPWSGSTAALATWYE